MQTTYHSVSRWLSVVVCILAHVADPAWADEVDKAKRLYDARKHDLAVQMLTPLAKAGDPRAQVTLAKIYLQANGLHGVKPNKKKGFDWLERAAATDDTPAIRTLGFYLMARTRSQMRGYRLLRKAAARGDAGAQAWLGHFMLHRHIHPIPGSDAEARRWLIKGAVQRHHHAIYTLFLLDHQEKRFLEAHKWELIYHQLYGAGMDRARPPFRNVDRNPDRLTRSQIAEARRRAIAWLKTHGDRPLQIYGP